MADDNVELFWEWVNAFNSSDEEWILDHVASDLEFVPLRAQTEGSFHGRQGLRRFLKDTEESFDLFQIQVTEVRDFGDGRVLGTGTIRIRGKGSGIETDVPTAAVVTFRDGLLTHFKDYGDRQTALDAAGLD
jgi:ketosteroid isomerase-like protein